MLSGAVIAASAARESVAVVAVGVVIAARADPAALVAVVVAVAPAAQGVVVPAAQGVVVPDVVALVAGGVPVVVAGANRLPRISKLASARSDGYRGRAWPSHNGHASPGHAWPGHRTAAYTPGRMAGE